MRCFGPFLRRLPSFVKPRCDETVPGIPVPCAQLNFFLLSLLNQLQFVIYQYTSPNDVKGTLLVQYCTYSEARPVRTTKYSVAYQKMHPTGSPPSTLAPGRANDVTSNRTSIGTVSTVLL